MTSPSSEKGQNTEPETIDNVVADRIKDIKSGKFDKVKDPQTLKHFRFESKDIFTVLDMLGV